MLLDRDVIIWYLLGNKKAYRIIKDNERFSNYLLLLIWNLLKVMRNNSGLAQLRKALEVWNTKILYPSKEISTKAMFYVEQYFLSHSM